MLGGSIIVKAYWHPTNIINQWPGKTTPTLTIKLYVGLSAIYSKNLDIILRFKEEKDISLISKVRLKVVYYIEDLF